MWCVDGGAFVQYESVSCPEAMMSAFQESCAAECHNGAEGVIVLELGRTGFVKRWVLRKVNIM